MGEGQLGHPGSGGRLFADVPALMGLWVDQSPNGGGPAITIDSVDDVEA
jgi:hypothetical protein